MKLSRLFLLLIFFSFFVKSSEAQTTFEIDTVILDSGSVVTYCIGGHTAFLYVEFKLSGYTVGDSVTISANWGDGIIDTKKAVIYGSPANNYCSANFGHSYSIPGTYKPKITSIAPDLKTDSMTVYNTANVDVCGNIKGTVYFDTNSNCTKDVGEKGTKYMVVELINNLSTNKYYAYTDASGNYSAKVPATGTYSIKINNNFYSQYCPASGYPSSSAPSVGNDFAIQCGSGFDLTGIVNGFIFRPGWSLPFWGGPLNSTCNAKSGTFKVVLSDPRIRVQLGSWGSRPAPTISGDTLIWNFTNIDYRTNQTFYGYYYATYNWRIYTDTTATLGDTICFDMIVEPISGDNDSSNNIRTFCFEVSTSYDPNNKIGLPIGYGPEKIIRPGTPIDYTINFQNTGTDTAFRVILLDTLAEELDLSSIVINGASHEMQFYIGEDRVLKFEFPNIELPDSTTNEPESRGFVNFTVQQEPSLPPGTFINNTAYIYFDYNVAVVTNTETHKVDIISGVLEINSNVDQNIRLYPNPSNDELWIEVDGEGQYQLRMMSILGTQVHTGIYQTGKQRLDVNYLKNGVYFVEVINEKGRFVQKLIIQH